MKKETEKSAGTFMVTNLPKQIRKLAINPHPNGPFETPGIDGHLSKLSLILRAKKALDIPAVLCSATPSPHSRTNTTFRDGWGSGTYTTDIEWPHGLICPGFLENNYHVNRVFFASKHNFYTNLKDLMLE